MSNGDVSLIQSLYAAFGRADIAAVLGMLSHNIDWQTVGTGDYPVFGRRQSLAEVQQFFKDVAETEEFSDFSPTEFYAMGGKVFVLGSYAGPVRKTGKPFAGEWVHVFTIQGGKVVKFREFSDTAQLVDAYRG